MRREYRRQKANERFFNYLYKTWKNKVMAIAMMICGALGLLVVDDATALVFISFIAVPMFFSSKRWVY
jgi:hypothetical protein